jgi:hypothetical protein
VHQVAAAAPVGQTVASGDRAVSRAFDIDAGDVFGRPYEGYGVVFRCGIVNSPLEIAIRLSLQRLDGTPQEIRHVAPNSVHRLLVH